MALTAHTPPLYLVPPPTPLLSPHTMSQPRPFNDDEVQSEMNKMVRPSYRFLSPTAVAWVAAL